MKQNQNNLIRPLAPNLAKNGIFSDSQQLSSSSPAPKADEEVGDTPDSKKARVLKNTKTGQ